MRHLQFTEEDLTYNRQGTLSPSQAARLKTRRSAFKRMLFIIGALLLGGGALAFLPDMLRLYSQGDSEWVGMAAALGVLAALGLPLIYLGVKPMRPARVAAAKGRARVVRAERISSASANSPRRTFIATELHIAGKIFNMPDAAFPELEDGAVYAVYYWEGLDEVFSLEQI